MAFRTLVFGLAAVCMTGCAVDGTSEDASDSPEATPSEAAPPRDIGGRPQPSNPDEGNNDPCYRYDRVIIQGYEVYYPVFCSPPPTYVGDPPPTSLPASPSDLGDVSPEDGRIDDDGSKFEPRPCYGLDGC
jgi:hypothetical protein